MNTYNGTISKIFELWKGIGAEKSKKKFRVIDKAKMHKNSHEGYFC